MKTEKPVGIAGYGAFIPRLRVSTRAIANCWGVPAETPLPVKEKSVPGLDEDTTTMAIEAARNALRRAPVDPRKIRAVWVGTESKPYAVKPSSTIVAEAIGATPEVSASDFEFACKAGSEAMQTAVAYVASGMADYAMAIGMDTSQSKPGSALEYTAGAGGAAFLFARAEEAIALVEASQSYATDIPDFFRREHMHYPEHGYRFTGDPAYFLHTRRAVQALLREIGAKPQDYRYAVFHQPNPKFAMKVAEELGFSRAQIRDGLLVQHMGNCYAGSSLLGLAAILDRAEPGERILFCSYGSGAGSDSFSFRVTARIAESRGKAPSVAAYLGRRAPVEDYGMYLRLRKKILL